MSSRMLIAVWPVLATLALFFGPAFADSLDDPSDSNRSQFRAVFASDKGAPCSNVLVSDSFDRPDADRCSLGQMDQAHGGQAGHYYLPLWPGVNGPSDPTGASIVDNRLMNNGLDFGGVQITSVVPDCSNQFVRGKNMGQDLTIQVDLFVPSDVSGNVTRAGPFFRGRAAGRGDGLHGGDNAGYWVMLDSHGILRVQANDTTQLIGMTNGPGFFDSNVSHNLAVSFQGDGLLAWLDGVPQIFTQNAQQVSPLILQPTGGSNDGTLGISFGAQDNRGQIGGQWADNFVVSEYCSSFPTPTETLPTSDTPTPTRTSTVADGTPTSTPTETQPPASTSTSTPILESTNTPTSIPTHSPTATSTPLPATQSPTPTATVTPSATVGTPVPTLPPQPVDRVEGQTSPDLSGNGSVGSEDLYLLKRAWDAQGNQPEDLDLNGRVAPPDLIRLEAAWKVSAPSLATLSPDHGKTGDSIALTGTGFGDSAAEGEVSIQGMPVPLAQIQSWSDTAVSFQVPAGFVGGALAVLRKGVPSNTLPFARLNSFVDADLTPAGGLLNDGAGLSVQIPAGVVPSAVPFGFGMSDSEGSPAYIPDGETVPAVVYMDRMGENPGGAIFTISIPLSTPYPEGTELQVLRISPISGQWGAWAKEVAIIQPDGSTALLETARLESFLLKPIEVPPVAPKRSDPPSKQTNVPPVAHLEKVEGFGDSGTPIILVHGNRSEYRPSYSYGKVVEWARNRAGFADAFRLFHFVHDSSKPIGFSLDGTDNSGKDLGEAIELNFPDPNQHVILWAHSRGGLVCRTYMNYYDPPWGNPGDAGKRVAALITFGSPHHGTPGIIGDWFFQTLNNHFNYFGQMLRSEGGQGNQFFSAVMGWNLAEDLHPIHSPLHRPGSVGLGWNNFDAPHGIPTEDFIYPFSDVPYIFLAPDDKNDRLEQLSNEERYKDRMICNGGYFDWNQSYFSEPAHLVGSALPIGDVNKEHVQLSVVSRVLGAFESEGMDPYLPHYLLNDGVVPLQSALFLSPKDPQAQEFFYPTEESGFLFWEKTVPKQPFETLDDSLLARVQIPQARWWPQYDHTDMADGHSSNNFAALIPNTLDDFDLYEAALDDLERVPVINKIERIPEKIIAGRRFRINGSGFGSTGEGKVFLTAENDPQAEGQFALIRQWGPNQIDFEMRPDFEPGDNVYAFVQPLDPPLIPMKEGFPVQDITRLSIDLNATRPSSDLAPRLDLYVEQPDGSTVWYGFDFTQIGVLVDGEGFNSILSGYIAPNPSWEGESPSEILPGTYTVRFHYHSLDDITSPDPPAAMPPISWRINIFVNRKEIFRDNGTIEVRNDSNNAPGSTGPDWVDVTAFDPFVAFTQDSPKDRNSVSTEPDGKPPNEPSD